MYIPIIYYFYPTMTGKNTNIDAWMGRLFISFSLFFVLSFSQSDAGSRVDSNSFSIEQVANIDNTAVLVAPLDFSGYDCSLTKCELHQLKVSGDKLSVCYLDHTHHQQFKQQEFGFLHIKPVLLQFSSIRPKIPVQKDTPLIS